MLCPQLIKGCLDVCIVGKTKLNERSESNALSPTDQGLFGCLHCGKDHLNERSERACSIF